MIDRNEHIKSYLRYYLDFSVPPRFAVLLNGPWGIGKTHFLKTFLRSVLSPETKLAYVSLNGINSIEGMDDALFRATYPIAENKAIRFAGRAAKAAFKYAKIEIDLADLVNKTNADVLVFDDLERCSLSVDIVLGYINEFVELEQLKVIIVAHENEIKTDIAYTRIKEKVIGRVFDVQSVFDQAVSAFFEMIGDTGARAFLKSKIGEIAQIYDLSGSDNLRILQQSLWDFERFYLAVADKYREDDVAISCLLGMLLAVSFELRAGRLTADDLIGRQAKNIRSIVEARDSSEPPSGFLAADRRYPAIDLTSAVLSDQTLSDMLSKGIIDEARIRADLDASSFFVKVADEPSWRTVWYALERTDEEFDAAFVAMEDSFEKRSYMITGELLHVFGLRLWLSKVGTLNIKLSEVVDQCKSYIDDLYNSGRIEPAPLQTRYTPAAFQGYGGLGMHAHETPEFRELFEYLDSKRQVAKSDQYPNTASELLSQMTSDPELFGSRISFRDGYSGEFYNVPVLAALDTDEFVTALLSLSPAEQRSVLTSLYIRYDAGNIDRSLASEKAWVQVLRDKLMAKGEDMPPMAKFRVGSNVRYALDSVLGLANASQEGADS